MMWVQICVLSFFIILIGVKSSNFTEIEEDRTNLQECKCDHLDCECCYHFEIDSLKINGTLCSDFIYMSEDIGISITIRYNNNTIFNETLSVRNPPPICPILVEQLHLEACVRFYDIDFDKNYFHGCAEIDMAAFNVLPLIKKDLGCFHMGHKNSSINSVHPFVVLLT